MLLKIVTINRNKMRKKNFIKKMIAYIITIISVFQNKVKNVKQKCLI